MNPTNVKCHNIYLKYHPPPPLPIIKQYQSNIISCTALLDAGQGNLQNKCTKNIPFYSNETHRIKFHILEKNYVSAHICGTLIEGSHDYCEVRFFFLLKCSLKNSALGKYACKHHFMIQQPFSSKTFF